MKSHKNRSYLTQNFQYTFDWFRSNQKGVANWSAVVEAFAYLLKMCFIFAHQNMGFTNKIMKYNGHDDDDDNAQSFSVDLMVTACFHSHMHE